MCQPNRLKCDYLSRQVNVIVLTLSLYLTVPPETDGSQQIENGLGRLIEFLRITVIVDDKYTILLVFGCRTSPVFG